MQYLPSKKFLVVAIAALIVLGAWFLVSYKSNSNNDNNSSGKFSYISSLFKSNDKDSDNDGLKDWEEALWKTDLNNSDTDRDGTPDGEEVNLGRDPLNPGPDDLYSKNYSFAADKTNSNSIDQLSATEKLSRDFLSQYLSAKALMGGKLNESTKENLINSFLTNIDNKISSRVYTSADIKISQDNSKEAVKNYANQLGSLVKKYSGYYGPGGEILIFKKAIEENKESDLELLNKNIETCENLIKDTMNLIVPSDLMNAHLNLINSFSQFKDITVSLRDFFQDPLKALTSLDKYYDVQSAMVNAFVFLRDYFEQNGILFDQNEPGYFIQDLK